MSLNKSSELKQLAKQACRDLRKKPTGSEKKLWEVLRNNRLNHLKFYRQYPIFYEYNGRESFFIADFLCYNKNLIVEADGKIHEFKKHEDKTRTFILEDLGYKVIRVRNEVIDKDLEKVIALITGT